MEGQDKTRMLRDGRRVLERLAAILKEACGECVLVAREEQRAELEALDLGEVYGDLFPERGPLGGLYTVLEETEDDVFLAACDLPFLEKSLVEKILNEYKKHASKIFALVPRSPDPAKSSDPWRAEPLCTVWSKHCKRPAYIAMEAQELSLTRFAHGIHARYLDLSPDEAMQLRNINTVSELQDEGLAFPTQ